jgi:hypothetical protein
MKRTSMKRGKPLPRPTKPLGRTTRVKAKNPKRKAAEFARCYGSRARVAFVKALPCCICGGGPCDNAHLGNGGMGRKSDYPNIVPLCRTHHQRLHRIGLDAFEDWYSVTLAHYATWTETLWQKEQTP